MSVRLLLAGSGAPWKLKNGCLNTQTYTPKNSRATLRLRNKHVARAFFYNPTEDPVVKEALKEPVAFMGGVFAGLLRLDLNDDPLKEWVSRTMESAGAGKEELDSELSQATEDVPQQIEIE